MSQVYPAQIENYKGEIEKVCEAVSVTLKKKLKEVSYLERSHVLWAVLGVIL